MQKLLIIVLCKIVIASHKINNHVHDACFKLMNRLEDVVPLFDEDYKVEE